MSFVECPEHPGKKILAYQQTAFTTPCSIELDMGQIEIEMDDRSEHVRDMETTTIVCYLCSVDGCTWSILPEQLSDYSGRDAVDEVELTLEEPLPKLVHEKDESPKDFGHREDLQRMKAMEDRKAAAEAEKGVDSPIDKFKRVFGGP